MISGSVCASPGAHVVEHVLQLGGLLLGQLDVAVLALAEGGDFARTALVGQHHELVAGLRHFGQALDFDRDRRAGLVDRLAVFVEHGAHAAVARAGQHHVAALQRAATAPARWPPGRGPCRAALRSPGPWPWRPRGALQLQHFGLQQHLLEQGVDALAGLGRHRHERRIAAEVFRHHLLRPPARSSRARCWPRACRSCSSPRRSARRPPWRGAMASLVCGITPSSAATTRITMSVALAPRARIAVNAAWPGVSRKVIMPRGVSHVVGADVLRDAAGLARRHAARCGCSRAARSCRGRRGPSR